MGRLPLRKIASLFLIVASAASWVRADNPGDELPALVEPDNGTLPERGHKTEFHRISLGVNYTGAQVRWNFSPRWAAEGRYQQGKADSNYGEVKAQVEGLRVYRFFNGTGRFPLYIASEIAHVSAKPDSSNYKTTGIAGGVIGGFEYRMTKRLSLAIDLGPYVIALRENQTQLTQTTLDFVLNTSILLHLF